MVFMAGENNCGSATHNEIIGNRRLIVPTDSVQTQQKVAKMHDAAVGLTTPISGLSGTSD
jgi:hypothetical protein